MERVFVSYRHHQREWVWGRLVPALEAGGVEAIVDRDAFRAGEGVIGQMDRQQDGADGTVAVLSPEYLESAYCMRELGRGVGMHKVIPVVRAECPIPAEIDGPDPLLRVDLREPEDGDGFGKLLDACEAPEWGRAIERVARFLERGQSVNLVCRGSHLWRPLIRRVRLRMAELGEVDLEDPRATVRRKLVQLILGEFGYSGTVPAEPEDLVEFGEVMHGKPRPCSLAMLRFDYAARRPGYQLDFFSAIRYLVMESRKLVLLVQSHEHFVNLLPRDHPMSSINNVQTVEFGVRVR